MPNERRLRWTDWVGLVGLTLLLVWTPGYVAQDETERRLTGGDAFTLPMPRDGDRAVLDLVVTDRDGRTTRYESIAELRFDNEPIPNEGLVGIPTAGRFSIIYHEANISLDYATYLSTESMRQWFFDDDGLIVWVDSAGIHPYGRQVTTDQSDAIHGRRTYDCNRVESAHDYAGQPVVYEPNTASAILADMRAGLSNLERSDDCGRSGGGGYLHAVNEAYETDVGTLYGRHLLRGDRVFDRLTQDPTSPLSMCTFDEDSPVFFDYYGNKFFGSHDEFTLHFQDVLWHTKGFETRCDYRDHFERWDWLSPHFPIPVGQHVRHEDADGNLLFQLDLIPSLVERGTGQPIEVLQRPNTQVVYQEPERVPTRPLTMTLGDVEDDPDIRLGDRTLSEAAGLVRNRAEGALDGFLAEDAHLVTFLAATNGSAVQTGQRSSVWLFTFAHTDGAVRTALLTATWSAPPSTSTPVGPIPVIDDTPAPAPASSWTYQVNDACADPTYYVPGPKYCGQVDPARTDPMRPIIDITGLLNDIEAFSTNGRGTLRDPGPTTFSSMGLDALNDGETSRGPTKARGLPTFGWSLAHIDENQRLIYEASGTHDLETGAAWDLTRADLPAAPNQNGPALAPTQHTSETFRLERQTPVGTGVAWSGVALLALASLVRLMAAITSGTIPAFAAGLYAKIRNEDVLLHERRDAIVAALRADPGMTAKELAAVLEAGWGATVHHLETLQRTGLVTRVVVGRNRHHFLAKETTPAERRLVALRKDPAYAAFLDAVAAEPGRNLDEIAAALPRGLSGLSRTGTRLARDGVVEKRKEGRMVRFYPADLT